MNPPKPRVIEAKLSNLPSTLDETYERILNGIDEDYQADAFSALMWLACSTRPLTLEELEEVCIVDSRAMPYVDEINRGSLGDVVVILGSLVTVTSEYVISH